MACRASASPCSTAARVIPRQPRLLFRAAPPAAAAAAAAAPGTADGQTKVQLQQAPPAPRADAHTFAAALCAGSCVSTRLCSSQTHCHTPASALVGRGALRARSPSCTAPAPCSPAAIGRGWRLRLDSALAWPDSSKNTDESTLHSCSSENTGEVEPAEDAPPLPLAGASIVMERERQQNGRTLVNG